MTTRKPHAEFTYLWARETARDYMAPRSTEINVFAQTGEIRVGLVEALSVEISEQQSLLVLSASDRAEVESNITDLATVIAIVTPIEAALDLSC